MCMYALGLCKGTCSNRCSGPSYILSNERRPTVQSNCDFVQDCNMFHIFVSKYARLLDKVLAIVISILILGCVLPGPNKDKLIKDYII